MVLNIYKIENVNKIYKAKFKTLYFCCIQNDNRKQFNLNLILGRWALKGIKTFKTLVFIYPSVMFYNVSLTQNRVCFSIFVVVLKVEYS